MSGREHDDAEERKLWPAAPPSKKCSKCGAEMSNQFMTSGEANDTRRFICPKCGNQEMRSDLSERVTVREEVTVHKTAVTTKKDTIDDSNSSNNMMPTASNTSSPS
jgi:DNA-directed RNA polymerase subunit M/transcription elongation factor TFIIS